MRNKTQADPNMSDNGRVIAPGAFILIDGPEIARVQHIQNGCIIATRLWDNGGNLIDGYVTQYANDVSVIADASDFAPPKSAKMDFEQPNPDDIKARARELAQFADRLADIELNASGERSNAAKAAITHVTKAVRILTKLAGEELIMIGGGRDLNE